MGGQDGGEGEGDGVDVEPAVDLCEGGILQDSGAGRAGAKLSPDGEKKQGLASQLCKAVGMQEALVPKISIHKPCGKPQP